MPSDVEKKIWDDVLKEGTMLDAKCFYVDDIKVQQWVVELAGEEYHLTKHNGEWVYFHHVIKPKEDHK